MQITKQDLPKSQVELKVELNSEDIKPHMLKAATHIAHHLKVDGFRPGKAPYDIVKREVGEEQIFNDALDEAVNSSLVKAMQQENLFPYGDPDLKIDKISPLEEIHYSVTMDVYPKVELGPWPTDKIKKNKIEAQPDEIKKSIADLTKMLVREEKVDRPAQNDDSVVVNFDVLVNGVPIEGGSAKDFTVVIGENKMIPGFEEQLIGKKAGDNIDFKLTFPKDYKADLAGKEADFKVSINQILQRTLPEVDDELAKKLGLSSKEELNTKLSENIVAEKMDRENQRVEIEALKKMVASSKIGELPEKMIQDEVHRLLHEFEHDLNHQGMNLQTYLGNVGKSKEDIENEFKPKAIDRIKTSLVVDQVADLEKISVDEKEAEREWEEQKLHYAKDPQVLEQVTRPEYRRHLRARMIKIKAVEAITKRLVE